MAWVPAGLWPAMRKWRTRGFITDADDVTADDLDHGARELVAQLGARGGRGHVVVPDARLGLLGPSLRLPQPLGACDHHCQAPLNRLQATHPLP